MRLGLDSSARVLCISTEGATDRENIGASCGTGRTAGIRLQAVEIPLAI